MTDIMFSETSQLFSKLISAALILILNRHSTQRIKNIPGAVVLSVYLHCDDVCIECIAKYSTETYTLFSISVKIAN